MRGALFAAIVITPLSTVPVMAQTAPDVVVTVHPTAAAAVPTEKASLAESAARATTFKVGSTIVDVVMLSYATSNIFAGTALSAFMLGSSWLLFTTNDYLWNKYDPPPVRVDGEAFDLKAAAWRNTLKYLTFKPVIASIKLISLYLYTGSPAITGVFGLGSIVVNSGVFYANNMAWDMYDWYSTREVPPAKPASSR
jgi:uncharacterized membrane protein